MTALLGLDAQQAALLGAVRSGRFHHAWLLAGPKGVGKASFADAAARRLLAEAAGPAPAGSGLDVAADHPTARLIDAGSHPDFARLSRLAREKTGDLARNISVDQVRGLQRLFATAPTFSPLRVVVIDALDDLEPQAANALLKNLEEPPPGTLFLLVSHAPGRLLPTIRSRCRLLRFTTLADNVVATIVARALPDVAADELAALVEAGQGAPGRALHFAGLDIAGLDAMMTRLLREGEGAATVRSALAQSLSTRSAQPRYEAFLERVPARL
ncbi:MAG TPA: AAA family ATPase, partial [Sphingomonadaceae bacterium]|nr:AAA family ATPase [Sphingomonadaceae bacterium]